MMVLKRNCSSENVLVDKEKGQILKIKRIRIKPNIFSLLTRKLYALTPIFMSVQAVEMFEGYTVIYINSTLNMTLNNLKNYEKKLTCFANLGCPVFKRGIQN